MRSRKPLPLGLLAGALVLCAIISGLLILPPGLAAKERRGADIVVTKLDGSRVEGELIAVKPDLLLVLSVGGRDESVALSGIKTVKVVRRSHAATYALVGLLAGAVTGVKLGDDPDIESGELKWGAIFGGIGAVAGIALSQALGTDITFALAGESRGVVDEYLDRLRSYSRVGRSPGDETRATAAKRPGAVASGPGVTPAPVSRHEPRFKFSLTGWAQAETRSLLPDGAGSFRLPDEPSSGQGPYPATFGRSRSKPFLSGFALGVAYEWKEHWLVEVELFDMGESVDDFWGTLAFTSAADGTLYVASFSREFRARFTGLTAGLTYRTAEPAPFRRVILEFGAAAGPALVRGLSSSQPVWGGPSYGVANPIGGQVVLAARVSAALDYYLYPNVSIGVVAAYRLLGRGLSGRVSSGDELYVENGDFSRPLTARLTEISFPELFPKLTGSSWGLRVSCRI
jgi:hypothetical protein